ncbi:alpha-ketoacid dehydrogenase subunit beta [Patescibacteria group bacterium]|nr:MAG: alpha-ketoacid dehydrogenase subunit beta [Patescibacteria group bacterium]
MDAPRELSYAEAIAEATDQAMQLDRSVIVIGQGTRDRGHIFGTVAGLFEKYGPERIIEMPLSEAAVAGVAIGAALDGLRPVLILQRTDFVFLIMDQLINQAAKWRFTFGGRGRVPLTLRLITGKGWGQGPQHSQSLHATFGHFPGLRVAMPTEPDDAKGLLLNAIFSDDPTVILETRPLFARRGEVPEAPYTRPFGRARILRPGSDVTVVATAYLLPEALAAAASLAAEGISAEVIDPVSVSPLDQAAIIASVSRTRRLVVADASWAPFGFASELAAIVGEKLFGVLSAPVRRVTLPFTPAPTARALEQAYYPNAATVAAAVKSVLSPPV